MGDSLQSYFSNLLGCHHPGDATLVVDNARPRSSATSETSLEWLMECCSVDTTNSCSSYNTLHSFSRWESEPNQSDGLPRAKRDSAIQRPRRRTYSWNDDRIDGSPSSNGSDLPPADYTAIFPSSDHGSLVQDPLSSATSTMSRQSQVTPYTHSPRAAIGGQLKLSRH